MIGCKTLMLEIGYTRKYIQSTEICRRGAELADYRVKNSISIPKDGKNYFIIFKLHEIVRYK